MISPLLNIILFTLGAFFNSGPKAEIVFAGDAMQHQAQIDAARRGVDAYDYSDCFKALEAYVDFADYAVVNLETPLAGKPYTGYPCFSAPDSYLDALRDAGFDMMLTANNHTLDKRDRGLLRTLDILDSRGVDHLGTYRNLQERDSVLPFVRNINGFKIAFLNYTYGTNGIKLTTDAKVDYIDRALIKKDVAAAREAGAELVTVCIHWGNEYQLLPDAAQRSLADYMIAEGVDLIIGSHPHVIQPMEMRRSPGGRNALIVYSLGNFISNMKTRDTRGGAMVKVVVARDSTGRATVDSASYRLVFTMPPSGRDNFKLFPAEKCQDVRCTAFAASADAVFQHHNIGVVRDTSYISEKKMSPLDIFFLKTFGALQK